MAESQVPYPYSNDQFDKLRAALSAPRLGPFLHAAGRSPDWAMRLYLWNARLSKALRFPLEIAEVTLRNRITVALTDRYGADWPRNPAFLAHAAQKTAEQVTEAIARLSGKITVDRIIAELGFGFWVALLKPRFLEHMWRNRFSVAFPNIPKSLQLRPLEEQLGHVDAIAEKVRSLRNRISHIEPLLKFNIPKEHSDAIHLISIGCKTTAEWTLHHSTVLRTFHDKPKAKPDDWSAMSRGWRGFRRLDGSTARISTVLDALQNSERPFVIVQTPEGHVLVSGDDIARMMFPAIADGIADLDQRIANLLGGARGELFLTRAATLDEAAARFWAAGDAWKPRAAIITENGRANEVPLAIVDAIDLARRG